MGCSQIKQFDYLDSILPSTLYRGNDTLGDQLSNCYSVLNILGLPDSSKISDGKTIRLFRDLGKTLFDELQQQLLT